MDSIDDAYTNPTSDMEEVFPFSNFLELFIKNLFLLHFMKIYILLIFTANFITNFQILQELWQRKLSWSLNR